ncbi:Zinc finger HIT domain-containing protein 2 [Papilio machaon]|uniref:Zinc finger HIT domain-containing protein 2 n=1 Tax=Papilio machaon TaxID=76193 RepID=A0A194R2A1_PAPMA|nr:Zinc finger HIT domain-containing protein 2 [Papilio machaon]
MEESLGNKDERLCGICTTNRSKYCCPRCEIFYCSLDCYKSEKHLDCSESFYRDCVNEELSSYHAGDEAKRKMIDILKKVQNKDVDEEESETEESIDSDDDIEIDLHERIKDLDLNDADALWNALTEDEKNEFEAVVRGDVGSVLPQWKPWWMYNKEAKLVEEVSSSEVDEHLKKCPCLKSVPKFNTLTVCISL